MVNIMASVNAQTHMGQVQIVTPIVQPSLPPRTSEKNKLTKKRSIVLGFLQAVTAISVTGITFTHMNGHIESRGPNDWPFWDYWIWFGITFGFSAFFTILAGVKPSRGMVVAVIIVSIISIVASLWLLLFSLSWYYKDHITGITLLVTGLLQGVVSFTCLVLAADDGCCTCCKSTGGHSGGHVMYYAPNFPRGSQFVAPNQLQTIVINSTTQQNRFPNDTTYPVYIEEYKGGYPDAPPPYQE